MIEGDLGSLILIALCLLLSAFFSSSEAAFLSLQKTRIAHLVTTGAPGASRVARMVEQPERLLSTILLGNNLVNVGFVALVTLIALSLITDEGIAAAVATGVATVVILVFGEIVPKTIAVRHSERLAFAYARPLRWIETLLLPLVVVLQWISRSPVFGGGGTTPASSITEAEFRSLIDIGEAEGAFEPVEAEMLESVFRFGDRQVRELMTPRTEIVFVERGATLGEFLGVYAENTHTRFPVYKGATDNIIGILSAKDILKAMSSRDIPYAERITDLIRNAYFVPETKRIAELFDELRRSGNQMAMAVDEFGGVAGLITIKRLLEEVVGRVGEEGASPEEEYRAIGKNTYQVDGGMSIHEVNEELGIELPEGDFETIAGFVLDVLGHIPTQGEQLEYRDLKVEVSAMQDLKIETVRLTKNAQPQEQPSG